MAARRKKATRKKARVRRPPGRRRPKGHAQEGGPQEGGPQEGHSQEGRAQEGGPQEGQHGRRLLARAVARRPLGRRRPAVGAARRRCSRMGRSRASGSDRDLLQGRHFGPRPALPAGVSFRGAQRRPWRSGRLAVASGRNPSELEVPAPWHASPSKTARSRCRTASTWSRWRRSAPSSSRSGARALVQGEENKEVVVALREIAAGYIKPDYPEEPEGET